MSIDVLDLGLDEFGRVCLSDELLDAIDNSDEIVSAGANGGCPGSSNTSCTNGVCGYSINTWCSNGGCAGSTNRYCYDGPIE